MNKKFYFILSVLLLPFFFAFADVTSIEDVIYNIVDWLIGIGAAISVLMFVFAGFLFVTSAEDEGHIKKAKEIMKYAAIGLLVIMGAYMITSVIESFI